MKHVSLHAHGGPEGLRLEDAPDLKPGPGQVLIRVEAAGINFADIMRRLGTYLEPTKLPGVLGMEAAGTVEAVGAGVTHVRPGDRVLGIMGHGGGYAQQALAAAAQTVPLPDGLGFGPATALAVQGLTAWLILTETAKVHPGQSVLVHAAAGGVGTLAVQIAKLKGAGRVVATAGTAEKRALAQRLGADIAIDYGAEDWPARLLEATGGEKLDIVLETVGGATFARSLDVLAPFGRLVTFGAAAGERATLDAVRLLGPNHTVSGFYLGGWLGRGAQVGAALTALFGHVARGELEIPAVTGFPLAQAAEAHRAVEQRRTTGKVVLHPWA